MDKIKTIYYYVRKLDITYIINCMYSLDGELNNSKHNSQILVLQELAKLIKEGEK